MPNWLWDLYIAIDDFGVRVTRVKWLSLTGLILHQIAGQLMLRPVLHFIPGCPWWAYPVLGIMLGLDHELTQGFDAHFMFERPLMNFVLDVVAFIPIGAWA